MNGKYLAVALSAMLVGGAVLERRRASGSCSMTAESDLVAEDALVTIINLHTSSLAAGRIIASKLLSRCWSLSRSAHRQIELTPFLRRGAQFLMKGTVEMGLVAKAVNMGDVSQCMPSRQHHVAGC